VSKCAELKTYIIKKVIVRDHNTMPFLLGNAASNTHMPNFKRMKMLENLKIEIKTCRMIIVDNMIYRISESMFLWQLLIVTAL
jgi:hypothetical protein